MNKTVTIDVYQTASRVPKPLGVGVRVDGELVGVVSLDDLQVVIDKIAAMQLARIFRTAPKE